MNSRLKKRYKLYYDSNRFKYETNKVKKRWLVNEKLNSSQNKSNNTLDISSTTSPTYETNSYVNDNDVTMNISSTSSSSLNNDSSFSNSDSHNSCGSNNVSNVDLNSDFENINEVQEELTNTDGGEFNKLLEVMFLESGITKLEVLTMVYGLTLRHKLSISARTDILNMFKLCGGLPENDAFSTSNYFVTKIFEEETDDALKYNFYCKECKSLLKTNLTKSDVKQESVTCSNSYCKLKQKISMFQDNYFISVDTSYQLRTLLSDERNFEYLIKNRDHDENIVCDVHNGTLFQNLKKENYTLTYNLSTDGAPIFHSSKRTMWPLQLMINELPPKSRFNNLIFAGVWVGNGEPDVHLMNSIISVFVKEAKKLQDYGVEICIKNQNYVFRLLPLCFSVDSVARPVLQNRTQFNGYFGCSWCYQSGTIVNKQVKYPYQDQNSLRSANSHFSDLKQVEKSNYSTKINGVKGPAQILTLRYFDPVWGFPFDYMHGAILGVTHQLWNIWTSYNENSRDTFYIGHPTNIREINRRLLNIRPTFEIQRLPRPISKTAKWKATEWRSWLLFYSLPCLKSILPQQYLHHYALFVKSIFILLQDKITIHELETTRKLLDKFVKKMENLYGKDAMTFNVHTLLHVVDNVQKSGPLWATSTFPFESGIYKIKQEISGPSGVPSQISRKTHLRNTFFKKVENSLQLSEKVRSYISNLHWLKRNDHAVYNNTNNIVFLGRKTVITSKDEFLKAFPGIEYDFQTPILSVYKKCIFNQTILECTEDDRVKKKDNSFIYTMTNEFIHIVKFLSSGDENFIYGKIITCIQEKCGKTRLKHVFNIISENTTMFQLIPFEHFRTKCIFVNTGETKQLCLLPNTFESQ